MVSVTSASRYVTLASRCQSRVLVVNPMSESTKLAKAVPIESKSTERIKVGNYHISVNCHVNSPPRHGPQRRKT